MIRLFLILAFAISTFGADIIPGDRLAQWTNNVGAVINTNRPVFATLPAGTSAATFRTTIDACPSGQMVVLEAGTFNFTGTMDYQDWNDNTTVRGQGDSTIVLMTGPFYVRNQYAQPTTSWTLASDAVKDAYTVSVTSVSGLNTNHYFFVSQTDDSAYCLSGGLEGGHGPLYYPAQTTDRGMCQLVKLLSISGTTLTFDKPMVWPYSTAKTAQVRKNFYDDTSSKQMRHGIGFENFKVVGNDSDTDLDMFRFESAYNCWVTGVTITNMIGRDGVYIDTSAMVTVKHCNIQVSHSYAAGDGYGVGLYNGSSWCLIEDNIFGTLHIGVDMSFSATANVVAYNLFLKGGESSGTSPGVASHGHHNWMNLIEGNHSVEPLTGDITHGSGSHFTYLRNRVATSSAGTFSNDKTPFVAQYYNRYFNYVGNVAGSANYQNGYTQSTSGADFACGTSLKLWEIGCGLSPYDNMTQSHVLLGANWGYVSGNTTLTLKDEGYSTNDIVNSYYLTGKPAWFGNRPWPYNPVDVATAITNLPAGHRYTFGIDPPAEGSTVTSPSTVGLGGKFSTIGLIKFQ